MKFTPKRTILSLVIMLGLATALPVSVGAIDVFGGACGNSGSAGGNGQQNGGANGGLGGATGTGTGTANTTTGGGDPLCDAAKADEAPDIVKNIINTLLFVLGIIAVVMIIIGGIRYTTSNGDSSQIKAAKDTILYAVIGLIVAIMAFAIVQFIVGRLS